MDSILVNKISKQYGRDFTALDNISLTLPSVGLIMLSGEGGSGKTTLLGVLGGMISHEGSLSIYGEVIDNSNISNYRKSCVSMVYQDFKLIDVMTVGENISLAGQVVGRKLADDDMIAMLQKVGLPSEKLNNNCNELSGGEAQRIAICRALAKDSKIILADEPTGNLDSVFSEDIIKLLKEISRDRLVVIATHEVDLASRFSDYVVELEDGKVIRNTLTKNDDTLNNIIYSQLNEDCKYNKQATSDGENFRCGNGENISNSNDVYNIKQITNEEVVQDNHNGKHNDNEILSNDMPYNSKNDKSEKNLCITCLRSKFQPKTLCAINRMSGKNFILQLIFSFIVMIISAVMMVSSSIFLIDYDDLVISSLHESSIKTVAYTPSDIEGLSAAINDLQIDNISKIYKTTINYNVYKSDGSSVLPIIESVPAISVMDDSFYASNFMIECNDISGIGLELVAGVMAKNSTEIVISDWTAGNIVARGEYEGVQIATLHDMIGLTINSKNGKAHKIVGVYGTEYHTMGEYFDLTYAEAKQDAEKDANKYAIILNMSSNPIFNSAIVVEGYHENDTNSSIEGVIFQGNTSNVRDISLIADVDNRGDVMTQRSVNIDNVHAELKDIIYYVCMFIAIITLILLLVFITQGVVISLRNKSNFIDVFKGLGMSKMDIIGINSLWYGMVALIQSILSVVAYIIAYVIIQSLSFADTYLFINVFVVDFSVVFTAIALIILFTLFVLAVYVNWRYTRGKRVRS